MYNRWDNQVHEILNAVVVSVQLADKYRPTSQLQGKALHLSARGTRLHQVQRVNKQFCAALKSKKFDEAESLLEDDKVIKFVAKCLHQMLS
jgi:hypothetical protein